jgi:hypothetical protein
MMSGFLITLVCIVGLSIWAIVYTIRSLARSSQYAAEDRTIFVGSITESHAHFLKETFGLTEEELKQLHFDGYCFHFNEKQPCTKFITVSWVSVQDVTVVNSKLPHSTSWRYERVNGGPDRRYSNNPMTMTSRRFTLHFSGAADYILTIYGRSYWNNIQETLDKFNRLFGVATIIDLKKAIDRYQTSFDKVSQHQILLNGVKQRKTELESILAASIRLSAQNTSISNLSSKQSETKAELSRLYNEVSRLQGEITFATNEMAALVQFVRVEINKYRDTQILQAYGTK